MIDANETGRYKKRTDSDVSKIKNKSKHKHKYVLFFISIFLHQVSASAYFLNNSKHTSFAPSFFSRRHPLCSLRQRSHV